MPLILIQECDSILNYYYEIGAKEVGGTQGFRDTPFVLFSAQNALFFPISTLLCVSLDFHRTRVNPAFLGPQKGKIWLSCARHEKEWDLIVYV